MGVLRMNGRFVALAAIALASFHIAGAFAREEGDEEIFLAPYDQSATWTFVWENDYFADTDRNYTNGVRISYLSGFKSPKGVSEFIAQELLGADEEAGIRRGFAIGHSIFTPQDILTAEPLPDQHPYGAWLYGEYSVVVEQRNIIDQFSFQAGLVGPSAGGEFVQNNWHKLIGGKSANGWDNQIGDELGIVLSYERKLRALASIGDGAFSVDLTPSYGFSVGNIYTNTRAGLTLRFGTDLKNDYGPPRVRPSLAGGGYFSPRDKFSWYFFGGAEGRAVAHDIFLDGSLFRKSDPSVPSNIFVGDFQTGLVMQIQRIQIAYTYVLRTKEFKPQSDDQQFAAVSVSAKF